MLWRNKDRGGQNWFLNGESMNRTKIILNIIAYSALQAISMNGAKDEKMHHALEIVSVHNPLTQDQSNEDTHKKLINRNTNGILEGVLNLAPGIVECCSTLYYHQLSDDLKVGIAGGLAMGSVIYTTIGMACYRYSQSANQQDKNDYQLSASAYLTFGVGLGFGAGGFGYPAYLKLLSGIGGSTMVCSGIYHIATRLKQRAAILPQSWLNRLPWCRNTASS